MPTCSYLVAYIEQDFQEEEHQPICVAAIADALLCIAYDVFSLSHCGGPKDP